MAELKLGPPEGEKFKLGKCLAVSGFRILNI